MYSGFIIPVYNHGSTLNAVVQKLERFSLPIIIVDDGNNEKNKAEIAKVIDTCPYTILVTREKNGGKGRAMNDGVRKAHELGLTHVFQIDSDGQHDEDRVPFFLEESKKHPEAIICGYPEYDSSVPARRRNGRKIANVWAIIVSWNTKIRDSLCGFRIYPVEPYYELLEKKVFLDGRMGYDTDILVRMAWKGVQIYSYPVHVTYPADGISNFRMVRDNIHIAFTYTRLCAGMFLHIPLFIYRAVKRGYANA